MKRRIVFIWIGIVAVFLLSTFIFYPQLLECPDCPFPASFSAITIAIAAIIIIGLFLRIIRAFAETVMIAYEIGRMGILTLSPDECETCKEIQDDAKEEAKKISKKIPWWKWILLGLPVAAVAAACAAATIVTLGGAAVCIIAVLALIAAMLELAAEGEDVIEEKTKMEELKKKMEKHQQEKHKND